MPQDKMLPKEGERRLEANGVEVKDVPPPSSTSNTPTLSLVRGEDNPISTPAALTPEQIEAEQDYLERLERETASLPIQFWPPAEYQYQYSPDKIELLYQRKLIGKKRYDDWKKKKVGSDRIGDWQCAFCQFRKQCVPTQGNSSLAYELYDMDSFIPVETTEREA